MPKSRPKFFLAAIASLMLLLSARQGRADWTVTQPDLDGDGHADMVVDNDLLTAKFSASGGNIISLYDKIRHFENVKLFPNGHSDGIAQIRLSGTTNDIDNTFFAFTAQPLAGGSELVKATADVPLTVDSEDAGFLRVTFNYLVESGTMRLKVTTRIENHGKSMLNMVPWLKHLLYRGTGTNFEDMARVSFMTPYGVWDSNKPIPGRNGLRYDRMTDIHYLTVSNWIARTLQPTGPAANTLATVVEPSRMFKVYSWRKPSETMMTEEVILAPREVAVNAADEFSYYVTLTPALTMPAYASPLLNLEVDPHPLGLPASTKEITLRMAAVRDLGTVNATGKLQRLDTVEDAQPVNVVFTNVNATDVASAAVPVRLAPGGRYRLELRLSAGGKEIVPGIEVGDKDPITVPIVVDNELSTEVVYPSRVAGDSLFPRLKPSTVTAPLLVDSKGWKIFRVPTTQHVFEIDSFKAAKGGRQKVELSAAANEYQSLQLALTTSATASKTIKVAATSLRGPGGTLIPVEHVSRFLYAQTKVPSRYSPKYPLANYPDALLPTDSIEAKPGQPTPLFVTYRTPPGAPAGLYEGEVVLGEGSEAVNIPVSMRVWNFELPLRPALDVVSATRQGVALNPIYFQYKLTPANLSVSGDLLAGKWDAVKKQMPGLIAQGMSRTYLGSTGQLLEKPGAQRMREVDAFLKENNWLDYFYVRPGFDETTPDNLPIMAQRLREWKQVSSIATMENYYHDTGVENLYGLLDIYSRNSTSPWMKERVQKGDHFWRVNAMPSALESDLPDLWSQYLRMVDEGYSGTYLWTVSAWLELEWGKDWWADPGVGNLEASLIWKHESGYLPTIRLEALRDAIEGYGTYKMLKDRVAHPHAGDDPKLLAKARLLCDSMVWKSIKTDADVDRVRDEIGATLSALSVH